MDVSNTILFLYKIDELLNHIRRVCPLGEVNGTKMAKNNTPSEVIWCLATNVSRELHPKRSILLSIDLFYKTAVVSISECSVHFVKFRRQTISCRNYLTSFAVIPHPHHLSISLVPRYNCLDHVLGLFTRFFIEYYQICLIFFHSLRQVSAATMLYQHTVGAVLGFPWIPCSCTRLAGFLMPPDFEHSGRAVTFRFTHTCYFSSKNCKTTANFSVSWKEPPKGTRQNLALW